MRLELTNFGGVIPGTDPVKLPDSGAVSANNVDLSQGTIRPFSVTNAFRRLHNDAGVMVGEVEAGDVSQPSKPSAPSLSSLADLIPNIGDIFTSIITKGYTFDRTDGTGNAVHGPITLVKRSVSLTPTGFILHCDTDTDSDGTNDWVIQAMNRGETYEVVGPLYQFNLTHNSTNYTFPTNISAGSYQTPSFGIPLYSTENGRDAYQVGTLELVDVDGPQYGGTFTYPGDSGSVGRQVLGGHVDFHFNCNWIRNRPQRFFYLSQLVDSNDRDGPESDVSDAVEIPPGKYAVLTVPGSGTRRLYRSANTDSSFGLISEGTSDTVNDDLLDAVTADLPPNGAVPSGATVGSIIHPAGYAVYYAGTELRPSSEWINAPRYWSCPLEYAYDVDGTNIECIALAGGTILVFTQNGVYKASGQHPGRLVVYKVSDLPILNKLTLWRDETVVGWCNAEGLVQYDGGDGSLLTGPYMRADAWQGFSPSGFKAQVNDKAVCLFRDTGTQLRFDFRGDRTAAISTFTVTNGSAAAVWKSKEFVMPKPMAWYACRVEGTITGDQEILLSLFADGVRVISEQSITPGDDFLLPHTVKAWRWQVEIETEGEVRELTLATNRREL